MNTEEWDREWEQRAEGMRQRLTAEIKAIRVDINTCLERARSMQGTEEWHGVGSMACSFEIGEGMKKLIEARMWFGEALGKIGHQLPEEYRDEARQ